MISQGAAIFFVKSRPQDHVTTEGSFSSAVANITYPILFVFFFLNNTETDHIQVKVTMLIQGKWLWNVLVFEMLGHI